MGKIVRDDVFIPGGQPLITYIERKDKEIERQLARALASPNQIVSLAGPSKSGKTVLCRHVLGKRQYVWIEGGQIDTAGQIWDRVCSELNFPIETTKKTIEKTEISAGVNGLILSANGSQLFEEESQRRFNIDSISIATRHLIDNKISLIIDDFHYLPEKGRQEVLRNLKGAVFNGLRVVLLSVKHRIFDVIKAEAELTGRFASVTVPDWSEEELIKIPKVGFLALNMTCPEIIIHNLSKECQNSPFLMQKFCWEICFDLGMECKEFQKKIISSKFKLRDIFIRLSKDAGLPTFKKLVAGPPNRRTRKRRPLRTGGDADVYEVVLRAIAETGPPASLSLEKIRISINNVLSSQVPQKHEVTNALTQLSKISHVLGTDTGVDWDDDRNLEILDPYLRFYLRWQIRKNDTLCEI